MRCSREAPFDRHDWIVDRCGREVRYVIDFYAHDPGNGLPPTTIIDARCEAGVSGAACM